MSIGLLNNRKVVLVVAAAVALAVVCAISFAPSPKLTFGKWDSTDTSMWLCVDAKTISVGREGEPSFAILPHKANGRRVYGQDDLAKAHPYRLKLLGDGSVRLIREASGPSPKFEKVFRLSVRF